MNCVNTNQKKVGITATSDKTDFKARNIPRDKDVYHMMIKGSAHQEDIRIQKVCAPKDNFKKQLMNYEGK